MTPKNPAGLPFHLRFGDKPIKSTYFVSKADFVACHNPSYIDKYDRSATSSPAAPSCSTARDEQELIDSRLPAEMKRTIAKNNIRFYTIDATKYAKELWLGNRINTILQAAFFKLADIIPADDAVRYMKDAATNPIPAKAKRLSR